MKRGNSIQYDLSLWIISTTVLLVLAACLAVGVLSFFEVRDLQDDTLEEIGKLVNIGQVIESPRFDDQIDDETIVIHRLDKALPGAFFDLKKPLKIGFQTVSIQGDRWRALVVHSTLDKGRYALAQQTELRNEIAIASSLTVLYPMALLVISMLLIVHFIIRNRLKPLKNLAKSLDRQDATQIETISAEGLPDEIIPFVSSINALIERIQQAMQKQYRFIADAAHELRTPVAALTLMVENSAKANSEAEKRERQISLQLGMERLSRLVDQLLDLARLQSDHKTPLEAVSLNMVVKEVIADLFPLAEAGQVDLGVTEQVDLKLLDQQGRLAQLIRNAIDNAIRYTPPGGKVDISLTANAGLAIFRVTDSGAGIPASELQSVMEPFYRSQNAVTEGNGLGLAISAEIAQRLGGKIELSNHKNGGLELLYKQPQC